MRPILKVRRFPIALRLFLTVLLTTLLITTVSLSVLHWTMQKNFAKYVADVEMQKLDHLIENLGGVYGVYQDWGNAVQAQILQIEGKAAPDDYDKLSRWWLRRQYDIALQQRYFKEHTLMNEIEAQRSQSIDPAELKLLEENLPSEYQPFEGLSFPLSSNQNLFKMPAPPKGGYQNHGDKPPEDAKAPEGGPEFNPSKDKPNPLSLRNPLRTIDPRNGKKMFVSMPDRLGLSARLSLYDAKRQFILGEPSEDQISFPIWYK